MRKTENMNVVFYNSEKIYELRNNGLHIFNATEKEIKEKIANKKCNIPYWAEYYAIIPHKEFRTKTYNEINNLRKEKIYS